jgi:hypothetical protein
MKDQQKWAEKQKYKSRIQGMNFLMSIISERKKEIWNYECENQRRVGHKIMLK